MDKLQQALSRTPARVLRLLRHGHHLPGAFFGVLTLRLALCGMSFRELSRYLEALARSLPSKAPSPPSGPIWAIRTASRCLFPGRPCLPQALAVCFCCRRRGIPVRLQFGVQRAPVSGWSGHAWVEHGQRILIGGPRRFVEQYELLATFDF